MVLEAELYRLGLLEDRRLRFAIGRRRRNIGYAFPGMRPCKTVADFARLADVPTKAGQKSPSGKCWQRAWTAATAGFRSSWSQNVMALPQLAATADAAAAGENSPVPRRVTVEKVAQTASVEIHHARRARNPLGRRSRTDDCGRPLHKSSTSPLYKKSRSPLSKKSRTTKLPFG